MNLPSIVRYDIDKSYDWNYAHAPIASADVAVPSCPGRWEFCGIPIASPLGIPAGPLLNSAWIVYYAALGFDVLTYKTVRSSSRASYSVPNLVPVSGRGRSLDRRGAGAVVAANIDEADIDSWAISFGMPSKDPDVWQEDVEAARVRLPAGKVLVVSVVASPEEDWTLDRIASDFARCARMARDAGAHAIEANLSCPNVATREGDLYASAPASGAIAEAIRAAVSDLPLVLKVGVFEDRDRAREFLHAVTGIADAVSTTNTVPALVTRADGRAMFGGNRRGIGGRIIGSRCRAEVQMVRELVSEIGSSLQVIAVGGVSTADDVADRVTIGAHHVQLATAAMVNPLVGVEIRGQLGRLHVMNAHGEPVKP